MKRANGTGSITLIGGNRRKKYAAKESYRDADGIRHQRTLGTFATKKEAQRFLDAYNTDKERGTAPPPSALDVTIGDLWDAWSARELAGAGASKISNYTIPWKRRLSQYASWKIRDMRADDWQTIIDADVAAGLSSGSVGKLKVLINALSRYALERDYIHKDYAQYVKMPENKPVVEKGALSRAQIAQLDAMAQGGDMMAATVVILCYTGYRVQEFLDLTAACYHAEHGGYFIGGMKTDAGRDRIVPVHPAIAGYVAAWMDKGGDRVICNEDGRPVPKRTYERRFGALMEKIGLPQATPHWCRHTFATLANEAGMTDPARKMILGHSQEKDITAHYTHLGPAYLAGEMAKIPPP